MCYQEVCKQALVGKFLSVLRNWKDILFANIIVLAYLFKNLKVNLCKFENVPICFCLYKNDTLKISNS